MIVARLPSLLIEVQQHAHEAVSRMMLKKETRCFGTKTIRIVGAKAPSIRESAIVGFGNVLERKIETYFI